MQELTSQGDVLLREVVTPDDRAVAIDLKYIEAIKRRAEELIRKYPGKKKVFTDYMQNQEKESRVLETKVVWATWLLQKM